jgi:acetylornithine deacetylase
MSLDEALQNQILAAVEDNFETQLEFTKQLVSFPSRRGEEGPAQDFTFREMKRRGWAVDRFYMIEDEIRRHPGGSRFSDEHSNAPVVVGTHRPKHEIGRTLILQSHIDIVPEGPLSMWTRPPYQPTVDGDWLYGRGAGDMKAGHASMFAVFDALKRLGLQPAATVTVQSVVEEESTGNGALQCHLRGYRADAVVIPEPTFERLTRANVGVVWFRVNVSGFPVHASVADSGQNAIEAAYGVIRGLRQLEKAWNERKSMYAPFADLKHPINLNIGKIQGGDWTSSVPAWCSFDCRISLFPGEKPEDMMQAIEAAVAAASEADSFLAANPASITWTGYTAEGYVLEAGSEAETILGKAHLKSAGAPLGERTSTAYLDARVYALYDKVPTLVYGPSAELFHGFDERVSLSSLKRTTGALALFVAEWCGLEPI